MLIWVKRCALLAILVAVTIVSPANAQFGWGIVSNDSPWSRAGVITPPVHAGQERSIDAHVPLKRLPNIAPATYFAPPTPPVSAPGVSPSPRQSYSSKPVQTSSTFEILPPTTAGELTSPPVETLPDIPWQVRPATAATHLPFDARASRGVSSTHRAARGGGFELSNARGRGAGRRHLVRTPLQSSGSLPSRLSGRAAFENDQRIEWSGVDVRGHGRGRCAASCCCSC